MHNREREINRCIGSVVNSGMTTKKGAYEHLIINDASEDGTPGEIKKWAKRYPHNITFFNWKEHKERVEAYNAGMIHAKLYSEWVIWLDSDDELASHFKVAFEDAIDMYPNANIFTWGSIRHWKNKEGKYYRTDTLPAFEATIGDDRMPIPFKSGQVATGSFAFKTSCLNVTGMLPPGDNPYLFGKRLKAQFPELKKLYEGKDDLGNPWGNDFAMMYMLTRHWIPQPLNQILNYVHIRP